MNPVSDQFHFIKGNSATANHMRDIDWSESVLGPVNLWPSELQSYVNMLVSSPAAACILWGSDHIMLFNDAYLDMFQGVIQLTAIGSSFNGLEDVSGMPSFSHIERGMLGNCGTYQGIKILQDHGITSEKTIDYGYSPLYRAGEKVEGVILHAVEICTKTFTEKNNKEDVQKFQAFSDASPILTATCNENGSADYFSASWLQLTGRPLNELVHYGWIDLIHPDDREGFLKVYYEAVKKREQWKGSFRVKSKTSGYHLLAASGTPVFTGDNTFSGYISTSVDTTEQQKVIDSLQESEQNLYSIIHSSPIGICLLDAETLVSEVVNESFLQVAGKSYDTIAGQHYWDAFAEAKDYYEQALNGVVLNGQTFYANEVPLMLIRHGLEETIYVTFVYTPLKDLSGRVKKVAVWVLENTLQVTERQKVEKSERETRALIESAPFPIGVYTGKDMVVAFANDAILEVWGKGPNVIGEKFSEILPELDHQEVFKQLDLVYSTGKSFHVTNQRLDIVIDGKTVPFYFNYSLTPLFDSSGAVYGVMNTGANVTELNLAKRRVEENENNLRNTILQAPVAMCIFRGPEYVVEIANTRMLKFWGKTPEDVIGKPIFTGLPEAREQGFEQQLKTVYTSGTAVYAEAVPVTLPREGEVELVYVNFVYEAFREPDNTISGILAVAVDVTTEILAHQKIEDTVSRRTKELADSNNNLQKSNSELAQFAYIASHDLQEPLRKISVFAQMMENAVEGTLTGRAADYLSKIKLSAERMTALVRDVLAYSELGKKDVEFEKVDLQKIINGLTDDYELLIEQKNAEIICQDLPVIDAIALQMNQLFANLLSNALKYVRTDRHPIIHIVVSSPEIKEIISAGLQQEHEYIKIQISDNGIGIAPENLSQIFSIFKRLHRKSEFEGTGIGLAICKKIAQNHGGDINAEGSGLSGAVFNIFLRTVQ